MRNCGRFHRRETKTARVNPHVTAADHSDNKGTAKATIPMSEQHNDGGQLSMRDGAAPFVGCIVGEVARLQTIRTNRAAINRTTVRPPQQNPMRKGIRMNKKRVSVKRRMFWHKPKIGPRAVKIGT